MHKVDTIEILDYRFLSSCNYFDFYLIYFQEFFRPADNLYENEKWRHHCYIIKNEFPVYLYTPSFQEQYDKVFYRIEDMLKGMN